MDNNFSSLNVNSNCDVSTIFAGGGPPDAGAQVIIDGKQLIPSPFINLSLEKYQVGDRVIGGVLKLILNGTVTGSSFNEVVSTGAGGATGLKDIFEIGQKKGCLNVTVKCANAIVEGFGRVITVSTNEGNMPSWVNMAPYSIEMELYSNDIGLSSNMPAIADDISTDDPLKDLMLRNIAENFSININEDSFNWATPPTSIQMGQGSLSGFGNRHVSVNFSISAAGIGGSCSGTGTEKYGLEAVEQYMHKRINKLKTMDLNDILNKPVVEINSQLLNYTNNPSYLDFRTLEVNPIENSMSLTGQIIYRPSGCNFDNVFTTMNIEQNIDSEGTTFTLSGSIQGLISLTYDKLIKLSPNKFTNCNLNEKINNAENYLNQFAKITNLTSLASAYYKDGLIDETQDGYLVDNCPFSASSDPCESPDPSSSPEPPDLCDLRLSSSQINRNLSQGEINFTFVLSNKANCNILGARTVDVEITHDKPHDNIVEILIPGRGDKGVITQNLCCKSVEKYDISVTATLKKNSCGFNLKEKTIDELRKCAEKVLSDLDDQDVSCWFQTNNQETIGNNTYRLNQTFIKPSCP